MFTHKLPYQPNNSHYFRHLAHLPQAVWLDSCYGLQSRGQYDIISAMPANLLSVHNGTTYINNQPSELTIFDAINKQLTQLEINDDQNHNLPFTLGAIGYLGYDIAWQLEKLPSYSNHDITLPEAQVGIYHWSIVTDHHAKTTLLIAQNQKLAQHVIELLKTQPAKHTKLTLHSAFQSNMSATKYKQSFSRLKQHILDGDCYQANLCQRFTAEYSGNPWTVYETLRATSPAPYSAYINCDKGAILSLSPERFIQCQQHHVQTQPIKGTMPRYSNPDKDSQSAHALLNSEKDRAENTMIVDLLRNDISKICEPHSVKVPKLCELQSFSNVHHLVSTIEGKLKATSNSIDLLQHCFPGGSITGAPKISAMSILTQLEPQHRSAYCGSIFYNSINNKMDSNIIIRSLLFNTNKVHCYAGGGIVYDSTVEAEYQESLDKVNNLFNCLNRFNHTFV